MENFIFGAVLVSAILIVSSIFTLWPIHESVFITISNFLLLAMINVLTISRAGWKIAAWIDKWTIAVNINEKINAKNDR